MEHPLTPPTANAEQRAPLSDERITALAQQSTLLAKLPTSVRPAPLLSHAPEARFVVKTLDAEMARLELAVTRSGWTSWASTAALAALAWVFISLLDTAADFSWPHFAQYVTVLSLVQEFVYAVEYNLRPRRGFGLLAGSQLRVMRTTEALPFARPQFVFYLVRSALLAVASFCILPELVGGWWLAPFLIYLGVIVFMVIMLVLSMGDYALPKHEDAPIGELVGAGLALGVAWLGLSAMLGTWKAGDLPIFKAALVAIAAVHVVRGLTAPQYELPALEQLQGIRRKLGFGQLSALAAVAQAEAALVGHMALRFLLDPIVALQELTEKVEAETTAVGEALALVERRSQTLAVQEQVNSDDMRMQQSLIGQAIERGNAVLVIFPSIAEARERLSDDLERYKKGTKNDQSVLVVDQIAGQLAARSTLTLLRLLGTVARLYLFVGACEDLATRHRLRLDTGLRAALDKLQSSAQVRLKNFKLDQPDGTEQQPQTNDPATVRPE